MTTEESDETFFLARQDQDDALLRDIYARAVAAMQAERRGDRWETYLAESSAVVQTLDIDTLRRLVQLSATTVAALWMAGETG